MNENESQQSKIADTYLGVISSWYFVFVSLTVFSGLQAFFSYQLMDEGKDLRTNLESFHNHPYSIRNAASGLNVNVLETVNIWLDHNGISYSEPELEILLNRKFASIDSLSFIIKNNYLSPNENQKALWGSYNGFKNNINSAGSGIYTTVYKKGLPS